MAARRGALIRCARRVALNQRDAIERDDELFGDQLRLRGGETLTELTLPRVYGNPSIRANRNPRIELLAGHSGNLGGGMVRAQNASERGKADDETTGSLQKVSARAQSS